MPNTEIACTWTRVTGPTEEPVSLDDLKLHAGIEDSDSDNLLEAYIRTARESAEQYLGRGLMTQTWKLVLDGFANVIPLPMAAPLASVSSVKYYDSAGVLQTLATTVYDTDTVARPGTVTLKPDQTWPSVQGTRQNGHVEITYVVGWTTPDAVPDRIKIGIRLLAAGLDRERSEPGAAERARRTAELLWDDRVWWTPPSWC